jgi:CDP-diacylglycerol---serine O-phosphatidyltransferase
VSLDRSDLPAWKSNYFVGVPAPAGAIILLLPLYLQELGIGIAALPPFVLIYTLVIALLMVSRVPTFSGKLFGQRIAREHVPPVFVLSALFIGFLITYPFLTLTVGSLLYLAAVPVSTMRYFGDERAAAAHAKAQNGTGAETEIPENTPAREAPKPEEQPPGQL